MKLLGDVEGMKERDKNSHAGDGKQETYEINF